MLITKKNISHLSFGFLFFLSILKVEAKPLTRGESLFETNCSVCHLGGNNIIIPEKNLKKETLKENGMDTISAISYQIINGKNGMPGFGGRLTEDEIEEIASYILEKSEINFK
jgi:cytochrome c6